MLVLSRKVGERIMIGDSITIVVQRVSKGRVAIAIEAPHSIPVLRGELAPFGIEMDEPGEATKPDESDATKPSAAAPAQRVSKGPKRQSAQPTRIDSPNEHHAPLAQQVRTTSVLANR